MVFRLLKLVGSFLCIVFVLTSTCGCTPKNNNDNKNITKIAEAAEVAAYTKKMLSVPALTTQEFDTLSINKPDEDCFIYFGRSTCPYCRKFILSDIQPESIKNFFYIDTSLIKSQDKQNLSLLKIKTVPSVIKMKVDGTYSLLSIDKFISEVSQ